MIQEVRNIKQAGTINLISNKDIIIPINFTSYLPAGEEKIAYFTEDIGLNSWYTWMEQAGYMMIQPVSFSFDYEDILNFVPSRIVKIV